MLCKKKIEQEEKWISNYIKDHNLYDDDLTRQYIIDEFKIKPEPKIYETRIGELTPQLNAALP